MEEPIGISFGEPASERNLISGRMKSDIIICRLDIMYSHLARTGGEIPFTRKKDPRASAPTPISLANVMIKTKFVFTGIGRINPNV